MQHTIMVEIKVLLHHAAGVRINRPYPPWPFVTALGLNHPSTQARERRGRAVNTCTIRKRQHNRTRAVSHIGFADNHEQFLHTVWLARKVNCDLIRLPAVDTGDSGRTPRSAEQRLNGYRLPCSISAHLTLNCNDIASGAGAPVHTSCRRGYCHPVGNDVRNCHPTEAYQHRDCHKNQHEPCS
ncbi:MAG: hypothetical protein BWY85_01372 [Firmicutes bacterium ADurb.Bin506]|nr:MAG: hypothetical protein BWY85_01372 [Firmicutes bacterium ADurb.Bin506]